MADLPFLLFDADNHYYEAEDAFTRHIDPRMKKRCMNWATLGKRKELLVAGKVNRFRRDCDHVLSRRIVDSVTPDSIVSLASSVDFNKANLL